MSCRPLLSLVQLLLLGLALISNRNRWKWSIFVLLGVGEDILEGYVYAGHGAAAATTALEKVTSLLASLGAYVHG